MVRVPKLIDGVDAFHAAYATGRIVSAPDEYMDLILIPAILHTPTVTLWAMPPAMQAMTRDLLLRYIAGGWAGNLQVVKRDHA
jgi:hypothetical protein